MKKVLLRQLRRSMGIDNEEALAAFLQKLQATNHSADPEISRCLSGLGDFLARVDETYDQFDRDLDLKTRSLDLSSQELSAANDKLRHDLHERQGALHALRDAVRELLPDNVSDTLIAQEDLSALSQRLSELVASNASSQRELANQKFALDQHAIVSITDASGVITYANERFCQISGYERDKLIGQTHRLIKSAKHPAEFYEEMWSTISGGQVWHGEVCNRKRSGELYWVSATIVPMLDEHGIPQQYIGIRTDITDRKLMENQLNDQLHLVEELIEAIPLPVYLKDTQGRYLRLNRAFELFFDTQRERFIGKTLHDLLSPEDAAVHIEKDKELFLHGGVQSYEAVVHSRDGHRHDAIYRKAVLTRRDGSIQGLLGIIIDITERKQAEAEVMLARDAAEAASRAKSEFLANMSHEIRTPMNGVIGMTDLALDTELSDEQREYLMIVKSSADSLLTIINDILDFSKIEAGKLQIENISYDLHRVVSDTLKTVVLKAHEKGLELIFEILPGVPNYVLGDPGRLRQVLTNLVGNAIKFTERGEISVRVSLISETKNTAELHFSVADTGIGIAQDKQGQIFEAFTQEDTSTTRRYGGTGLGLSISRRLVELMGGRMWLESEIGKGSIFHFSMRLDIDQFPQTVQQDPFVDLHGRRILVVDDNETNRRVLGGMLATWEVEAVLADGAERAWQILAASEQAFDGIILDAHMPEVDGYELAQWIKTRMDDPPPMLMLSSGALRGDAERCRAIGIHGFFAKPISSEELVAALCRIFGLEKKVREAASTPVVTRHSVNELQRSLRILLVEDHPVNQKLAIGLLEKWGHRVTLASDGRECINLIPAHRFDLVLMDMQMPVMGGVESTLWIRRREREEGLPRLPIIAMTAAAMQGDRETCLAAGMDDYISKPIKAAVLFEKLQSFGAEIEMLETLPEDFDYARALLDADQETVEIISPVFIETWPIDLKKLHEGLAQDDSGLIERTAHNLRAALATFHAMPASRIAADIERRANMQRLDGLSLEIESLASEVASLILALENLKAAP